MFGKANSFENFAIDWYHHLINCKFPFFSKISLLNLGNFSYKFKLNFDLNFNQANSIHFKNHLYSSILEGKNLEVLQEAKQHKSKL